MIQGFWSTYTHRDTPFFALAPMADVTDVVFRDLIAKYSRHGQVGGGPDVFWTEFVSADGLMSPGREHLLIDLAYHDTHRPIVAQIFTANPESMYGAARLCQELGFDGVDINMGCPDRAVEKQGSGAAHIKNEAHAQTIIRAAQAGAGTIPVSVKTRLGYNTNSVATWIPALLACEIPALTVHARTRKELSLVPARWDDLQEVVALRNTLSPETLIIGNGDVTSLADGHARAAAAGVDGVMVGRGIFGTPWFFDTQQPVYSTAERLRIMIEHTYAFERTLGAHKSFAVMKKHYKAYVHNFDGAKELRMQLMDDAATAADVERITETFIHSLVY